MLDGMSDSIQGSRIENLQSREVDRQSPTGLIFIIIFKSFSYLYEVVCTNFSADFSTFCNF